jgi:hypothetical protein
VSATVAERTTRRPNQFEGFTQVQMGDEIFSECNECAALIRRIPEKCGAHKAWHALMRLPLVVAS